jgi:hypothetical protein
MSEQSHLKRLLSMVESYRSSLVYISQTVVQQTSKPAWKVAGACGRFLGLNYATSLRLCLYSSGLIAPKAILMRL